MECSHTNIYTLPRDMISKILEDASEEGNPTIQQLALVCRLFKEVIGDVRCTYNQATGCIKFKVKKSPHLKITGIPTISDHLKKCCLSEAKNIIENILKNSEEMRNKALFLINIAKMQAKMGDTESAKKSLKKTKKNISKLDLTKKRDLSALAIAYAELGEIKEAKKISQSISKTSWHRPYALFQIAEMQLIKQNDLSGEDETLEESKKFEKKVGSLFKPLLLNEKALALVQRSHFEEAKMNLEKAELFTNEKQDFEADKPDLLTKIALIKKKLGKDKEAQATLLNAKAVAKQQSNADVLQNICVAQIEVGLIQDAQATIDEIEEEHQPIAYLRIAIEVAKQKKMIQAHEFLEQAQQGMNSLEKRKTISDVKRQKIKKAFLEYKAVLLAELKVLKEARKSLEEAKEIGNRQIRKSSEVAIVKDLCASEEFSSDISASAYVALAHMKRGDLGQAKELIEGISDPSDRVIALLEIAGYSEHIIFQNSPLFKNMINFISSKGVILRLNHKFEKIT